jgi:PilZ domain
MSDTTAAAIAEAPVDAIEHEAIPHDNRRRHVRHPANWPATCCIEGGTPLPVTVVDVSEGGFGFDRDLPWPMDQILTLSMPDIGVFSCRLAWKSRSRSGVELLWDDQPRDAAEPAGEHLSGLANVLRST